MSVLHQPADACIKTDVKPGKRSRKAANTNDERPMDEWDVWAAQQREKAAAFDAATNARATVPERERPAWEATIEVGPDRVETLRTLTARGLAASEDQSPFAFAAGALLQLSEDLFILTEAYCEDDDVPGRLRTAIYRLSERAAAASELSYRFQDAERLRVTR